MPIAVLPILCGGPRDYRQHAVELSGMGNRSRRGGEGGMKFILFSSFQPQFFPSVYVNSSLHLILPQKRWNFADNGCFYFFRWYGRHILRLYELILRVLQGSFGTWNCPLFRLFKVIPFIWNRCDFYLYIA